MATYVYIDHIRQADYPDVPECKVVALHRDENFRIKYDISGTEGMRRYNFKGALKTDSSIETPNGYEDIIYRYEIDGNQDLHAWIACAVPTDTELPNPAYQELFFESTGQSYPVGIFLAEGETSPNLGSGMIPTWMPDATPNNAMFIESMKARVNAAARIYDNGIQRLNARYGARVNGIGDTFDLTSEIPDDEKERFNNTNFFFRGHVAYAWSYILDNNNSQSARLSVVQVMESQIPNDEYVERFFEDHDKSAWDAVFDEAGITLMYNLSRADSSTPIGVSTSVHLYPPADFLTAVTTTYQAALKGD